MGAHNQQNGILDGIIIPWASRLLKIPYLRAIRETFCTLMPVIVLLTLIDMAGCLLCDPAGAVLGEEGLGLGVFLSGGLHDEAYRESSFYAAMSHIRVWLKVTILINSLLFSLVLTEKLARLWHGERILSIVCTVSSYLFLLAGFDGNLDALAGYFTGRSFFLALLIATVSVLVFSRLTRIRWLRLPVPQGMPREMQNSMILFLPLGLTLFASLFVSFAWLSVEQSLHALPAILQEYVSTGLVQSPAAAILYELVRRFLWWLGLNGSSLTFFWNEAFYVPAQLANELENSKYIFTIEFFDANSISLLGLAISVWVFSSREKLRHLSAYSLPCLLFSINEPFLFALPIVLNPLFLVPYLLAPMLNVYIGYLAINCGIVPLFRYGVDATVPVFMQGWLSTGDVMGAVLQLVWLSLDIVIYTPFVIIFNMLTKEEDAIEEANAYET